MRAIGVNEYGGPEALEVVELPDPAPGPGEVLVRVHAATVNPTDTYVRNGARAEYQRQDSPPPYVPGMDVAGVLETIGPDVVTELATGDRVMGIVLPRGHHGGYSEKLALPVGSVTAAPVNTSHAEASTLPMNGLTARRALDLLALGPGQTLAVTGAAGALGGYVIQLAKADGLRVVADASDEDQQLVADLGADIVVPRGDDVADRIRDAIPGGADGLVDGSVQNDVLFPALADGAGFATVRGFQADAPRGITIHRVWVREYLEEQAKLDRLRQQVDDRQVSLRVARTFPAADAAKAHRLLERGGIRGRLVLEL